MKIAFHCSIQIITPDFIYFHSIQYKKHITQKTLVYNSCYNTLAPLTHSSFYDFNTPQSFPTPTTFQLNQFNNKKKILIFKKEDRNIKM